MDEYGAVPSFRSGAVISATVLIVSGCIQACISQTKEEEKLKAFCGKRNEIHWHLSSLHSRQTAKAFQWKLVALDLMQFWAVWNLKKETWRKWRSLSPNYIQASVMSALKSSFSFEKSALTDCCLKDFICYIIVTFIWSIICQLNFTFLKFCPFLDRLFKNRDLSE